MKCIGVCMEIIIFIQKKTIKPQESLKKHGKVPRVVQKKKNRTHDVTTPDHLPHQASDQEVLANKL